MSPRLFFIHIPKTAGSTFNAFLDQQYAFTDIAPPEAFAKGDEYIHNGDPAGRLNYLKKFSLYRGHYGYNACQLFMPEYVTLTVLRDPVERVVSQYNFWRTEPEVLLENSTHDARSMAALARQLPLRDFFQTEHPLITRLFHNGQARPLATDFGCDLEGQALQELALSHLEKIDYVGVTAAFDLFLRVLCERFGWHHPQQLQPLNTARHSLQVEDLDQATLNAIMAKNEVDLALYKRAKELALLTASRAVKYASPEKQFLDYRNQSAAIVTMLDSAPGTGWHVREVLKGDRLCRWTGPTRETTLFVSLKPQTYHLSVRVVATLDRDILEQSKLQINATLIPTKLRKHAGDFVIEGVLPEELIDPHRPSQLTLILPNTTNVNSTLKGKLKKLYRSQLKPYIYYLKKRRLYKNLDIPIDKDSRQQGLAIQEILFLPITENS
ncbi:MAG: hypothetical protein ACFBSF_08540 [Leptolyngbyaceae cyanobacterium]